jgi:Tfp pilus assembly protein PilF
MLKNKYYVILGVLVLVMIMVPILANIIKKSTTQVAPVKVKEEYLKEPIQTSVQTQAKLITQHLEKGENKLAIGLAEEYLTSNPNDIAIINVLAEVYINEGDLSAAETTVKRAMAIQPNNPWSSRLLVSVYRGRAGVAKDSNVKNNNLILAVKEVERGLASNPNDAWLLAEAAQVYSAQGDKVKANQKIDRAISIAPENVHFRNLKEKINE